MEKDFAMYDELLKGHEKATLISYPGLNHLFIHYDGEDKGTVAEYHHPGVVDENVLNDVVNWLLKHVQ
ncbi:hypothetical protein BKP35_04830 [Anaerobacillus arseniciselenatis]|uniref:Dienelactone hydrolase domain-containing protein n=1 Tax=Anaerobacillus arseniciselenatis TaxID=85682 RepID=A0A1S2LRP1_9BACI|nr:hypothetical protein [Anaerobacillus arseniciselenatis]OIJ15178.1 hypothetical protein BKP35_04830 [Anaerobacillus arseniciselenatis]